MQADQNLRLAYMSEGTLFDKTPHIVDQSHFGDYYLSSYVQSYLNLY